jgi:hypothetical protein
LNQTLSRVFLDSDVRKASAPSHKVTFRRDDRETDMSLSVRTEVCEPNVDAASKTACLDDNLSICACSTMTGLFTCLDDNLHM